MMRLPAHSLANTWQSGPLLTFTELEGESGQRLRAVAVPVTVALPVRARAMSAWGRRARGRAGARWVNGASPVSVRWVKGTRWVKRAGRVHAQACAVTSQQAPVKR